MWENHPVALPVFIEFDIFGNEGTGKSPERIHFGNEMSHTFSQWSFRLFLVYFRSWEEKNIIHANWFAQPKQEWARQGSFNTLPNLTKKIVISTCLADVWSTCFFSGPKHIWRQWWSRGSLPCCLVFCSLLARRISHPISKVHWIRHR